MNTMSALLTAAGFPDPDTLTQERLLWRDGGRYRMVRTHNAHPAVDGICPHIDNLVRASYEFEPQTTAAEREDFLSGEALSWSRQVSTLAIDLGGAALQRWAQQFGTPPDHHTRMQLLDASRDAALQIVVEEFCQDAQA